MPFLAASFALHYFRKADGLTLTLIIAIKIRTDRSYVSRLSDLTKFQKIDDRHKMLKYKIISKLLITV